MKAEFDYNNSKNKKTIVCTSKETLNDLDFEWIYIREPPPTSLLFQEYNNPEVNNILISSVLKISGKCIQEIVRYGRFGSVILKNGDVLRQAQDKNGEWIREIFRDKKNNYARAENHSHNILSIQDAQVNFEKDKFTFINGRRFDSSGYVGIWENSTKSVIAAISDPNYKCGQVCKDRKPILLFSSLKPFHGGINYFPSLHLPSGTITEMVRDNENSLRVFQLYWRHKNFFDKK